MKTNGKVESIKGHNYGLTVLKISVVEFQLNPYVYEIEQYTRFYY